jgi:hypothetical protein
MSHIWSRRGNAKASSGANLTVSQRERRIHGTNRNTSTPEIGIAAVSSTIEAAGRRAS